MTAPEQLPEQASSPAPSGKDQAVRRRRKSSIRAHGQPSSASAKQDELVAQRSRARALLRKCKHIAVKHTWTTPLVLILAFLSTYAINPTESNVVHHFLFLSYKLSDNAADDNDAPVLYGKGPWDIAFVLFYSIVLTFTREFVMQELLRPLAKSYGIRSKGKQLRFMEQGYTALYFAILGPVGMYVMSRTPVWYFNTTGMYELYPHRSHEAIVKFYYLFEAAYWAQQALVMLLGMEKPRKDYYELVAHHIVTLGLIGLSYRFHFTHIGIAVYLTHDISDFFMAMSKTLNYIDHPITGPWYCLSLASWIYLRHVINLKILWSILTEFRTVGPYQFYPDWDNQQYKCMASNIITFGLLGLLQALNLFWLFFLLRIGYRYVWHGEEKDDRSEAEESDVEPLETIEEVSKIDAVPVAEVASGVANGSAKRSRRA
ncbi:Sphingosine N-acyltransferase-like protein FUM17 [Colletotrichum aenigma]|uniref:Sphingosine N-acyltransferase-like protein FUM17 n=1 Tax=Colletotrichum aenigma TaxID=1215731 RepID=UPI001872562E|nr:Sphingosine N-acyltransferase-like protein FUM17 [Colletotrichum aenigma]KAF5517760.1 Sphingosine N-acyltransferase-like protein FUM17 [Colletotrichum aenigma]